MKKAYKIEVDCANCAAKMELAVSKLPGVTAVSVNYMTQKMTLELADEVDADAALRAITKPCNKIESDFSIQA